MSGTNLKIPRDWKNLWWAYLAHFVEGVITGVIAMQSVITKDIRLSCIALSLLLLYVAYQGLSFARKRDIVGRDVMDFSVGYVVGLLAKLFF